jgi:hypothetical protein
VKTSNLTKINRCFGEIYPSIFWVEENFKEKGNPRVRQEASRHIALYIWLDLNGLHTVTSHKDVVRLAAECLAP